MTVIAKAKLTPLTTPSAAVKIVFEIPDLAVSRSISKFRS
jgi:hypothetical protein